MGSWAFTQETGAPCMFLPIFSHLKFLQQQKSHRFILFNGVRDVLRWVCSLANVSAIEDPFPLLFYQLANQERQNELMNLSDATPCLIFKHSRNIQAHHTMFLEGSADQEDFSLVSDATHITAIKALDAVCRGLSRAGWRRTWKTSRIQAEEFCLITWHGSPRSCVL